MRLTRPQLVFGAMALTALSACLPVLPASAEIVHEEAVAIAAAVQAMWPVPVVAVDDEVERDTSWKFSGRWWNRPTASRRQRPYR